MTFSLACKIAVPLAIKDFEPPVPPRPSARRYRPATA
jgi:hypothetical protein